MCQQEGVNDPPSVSSINRLLRGSERRDDDGRKDYSIHGILGGKQKNVIFAPALYSSSADPFNNQKCLL